MISTTLWLLPSSFLVKMWSGRLPVVWSKLDFFFKLVVVPGVEQWAPDAVAMDLRSFVFGTSLLDPARFLTCLS